MRVIAAAAAFAVALVMRSAPASAAQSDLRPVLAASEWLNGQPSARDLAGKVVLVDVYTFACINCKHVQPNLRALYRDKSRRDLVIIGVHSPETPFEKVRSNLQSALAAQGVRWPVAVDNDFSIWNQYGVSAWPTQLVFDRHGKLRATIVGDSQDAEVDAAVDKLIAER